MSVFDMGVVYNDLVRVIPGVNIINKIILLLCSIMKFWLIACIIILPAALSFCRAAKRGDDGNAFINNGKSEE